MKQVVVISALVFLGCATWYVASRLSSDAIGLALGVIFGVIATLPAALLAMASHRRSGLAGESEPDAIRQGSSFGGPPQPPVIIVTGQGFQQPGAALPGQLTMGDRPLPALPDFSAQQKGRAYRLIGEKDEWIEE